MVTTTIGFTTSSTHKFTNPVRYFKANDPYYWEVDNIPLKQIQENCLWLKDNIEGANVEINIPGVSRANFDELRPYVKGGDKVARVLPGRYMSRVNGLFGTASTGGHDKLAELVWKNTSPSWESYLINPFGAHPSLKDSKLQELALQSASFDLNGLETLALGTWMHMDGTEFVTPSVGKWDAVNKDNQPYNIHPLTAVKGDAWPQQASVGFWKNFNEDPKTTFFSDPKYIQNLAINLCRQWRGVARTAVVDVPEELTIDVPPFDKNDYFYMQGINDEGPVVLLDPPSYRMDLLFIYSKTVDQTQTFINKFEGGPSGNEGDSETCGECSNPTKLTKATLGIVKGAGLGMNYDHAVNGEKKFVTLGINPNTYGATPSEWNYDVQQDSDGNYIMLGNKADEDNTSNGFKLGPYTKIEAHGSFPSPEDLLNLSPNLQEEQEKNSWELVGQTILPIAYIMVPNPDKVSSTSVGVAGDPNLINDYIIDIRPFFRTAELAFNERSGIAAAIPQLSYANPAVGELQLRAAQKEVVDYVTPLFQDPEPCTQSEVIANGILFGGLLYGPEGVILNNSQDQISFPGTDGLTQATAAGKEVDISQIFEGGGVGTAGNNYDPTKKSSWYQSVFRQFYYQGVEVPFFPSWNGDFGWVDQQHATSLDGFQKPNDWMGARYQFLGPKDYAITLGGNHWLGPIGMYKNTRTRLNHDNKSNLYPVDTHGIGAGGQDGGNNHFAIIRKRMLIDNLPDWVQNVTITGSFLNCHMRTSIGRNEWAGATAGLSFNKHSDIFDVSISQGQTKPFTDVGSYQGDFALKGNAVIVEVSVAFPVGEDGNTDKSANNKRTDPDLHAFVANDVYNGAVGTCAYPTVQWVVTGHSDAASSPRKTFYGIPDSIAEKTEMGMGSFTDQISEIAQGGESTFGVAQNTSIVYNRYKCPD